uniref:Uncharacterized protein n=1 Tax=Candidatus Kentrum sp. SD TaxID=2126332 RepID=A0A450YS10_9GAMM|nr:MAG: hypothetical protein BECKSD772F_GA0070984_11762 [Candidatus Kentron sp. SD]VFK49331.1 MAG: hypothetical protein BECKSD772E_GA0070983_11722 [Candidatus Kentron sp. SD]VFK79745.1 MAG: hypothetical protein BECKSD772D_GA0070982_10638 [Candidatus Kentron sp. SD]
MKHTSTFHKSETDIHQLHSMQDSEIVIDDDAPAWTPELFARAVTREGSGSVSHKTSLVELRLAPTA